jgi:hypothetical protein
MSTAVNEQKKSAALTSGFDSLLAATDAFRNVRAIILLGLTFIVAAIVGGLFGMLGAKADSAAIVGFGTLLAFLIAFYGLNAVGILIMREAEGRPVPSIMDGVLLSLFSSHRLLGVLVLESLIVVAAVIAVALVLFICKLPGLGPLLFTFAFPISAIVLGICVFALFFVMFPLAGPAVWSGSSVLQVIARLNLIARTKMLSVIMLQVILFFIVSFTAGLIFFVVMTGFLMTSGLSAGILDAGGMNFGQMAMMMMMGGGRSEGSGYLIAGGIGGGLLFAFASVVPALMYTKGVCIIYINKTADMNFAQAEAQLESGLASMKKKADEARERARQLAPQQPVVAAAPVQALACPNCHSPVAADDAFCGNCAHKLK